MEWGKGIVGIRLLRRSSGEKVDTNQRHNNIQAINVLNIFILYNDIKLTMHIAPTKRTLLFKRANMYV